MTYRTGFHDGRLGIGLSIDNTMGMGDNTGNPRYPLDVNGDIRLTGAIVDASGNPIEMMAQQRSFPEAISTEDIDIGDGTAFFESNVKITGDLDFTGTLKQDGVAFVGGATTLNELSDVLVENNSIWLGSDPSATTNNAQSNVAIGINALDSITDGGSNVSIGYEALTSNTSGSYNVALGRSALKSNTSGFQNVAIGENTLYNCVGAAYNVAIGREVLTYTNSGRYNIGLGYNAVQTNTTGYFNIGIGYEALLGDNPHTGEYNIGIGHSAGKSNKTGDHNISFGSYAGPLSSETSLNNRLYIGSSDASKGSNTFIYGHMDATNPILAFNANVGIGTTSPSTILTIKKPIDSVAYGSGTRMIDFKSYMTGYDEATVKASIYCGVTDKRPSPNTQAGYMAFMTTEGTTSTPTERMRIEYNGNVGIGTTSPDAKLEIYKTVATSKTNTTPTNPSCLIYGDYEGEILWIGHPNQTQGLQLGYNTIKKWSTDNGATNDSLYFNISGSTDMVIDTVGNVGIGTTSPKCVLNVANSMNSDAANNVIPTGSTAMNKTTSLWLGKGVDGATQNYFGLMMGTIYNGASYIHNVHSDGITHYDLLLQPLGGEVGIGRSSTSYKLDIKCSGGVEAMRIESTNSTSMYAKYDYNQVSAFGDPLYLNYGTSEHVVLCYHASISTGNVGIGTNSPIYPLDVATSAMPYTVNGIGSKHYADWDNWSNGPYDWDNNYHATYIFSARFAAGIAVLGNYLVLASDRRIKQNIVDVPDNLSLETLRSIPVRYYEYIDKLERGSNKTIGFIAQEVKELLPEAVVFTSKIIPDETREMQNISWEEIIDGSNNTYKLTTDLNNCSGIKYRFYVSNDISGNDEVMKEVVGNSDNTFTFDEQWNNVFCYGKEVDDFHTLDKNKLYTINFSATQELDRQQQADKARISDLEAKNTALENTVQTLISRITALENNSTN